MFNSHLYTDHHEIEARIARKIKSKELNSDDIMEWCQEVETSVGDVDNAFRFLEIPLRVRNLTAILPCNVIKIVDVYSDPDDENSRVLYNNSPTKRNAYINFAADFTGEVVYVNYYGTPIDIETGVPLIIRGHEQACEAYCIYNLFYEDMLLDRISIDSKRILDRAMEDGFHYAENVHFRHMDRMQLSRGIIVRHSQITKIGNMTLLHKDYEL